MTIKVPLIRNVLEVNERLAEENRRVFRAAGLLVINLMSGPGAGKTSLLERTIDVHIRSLRKKMGPHAILVETVRGIGYRFRDPAGAAK